ncbi:MAG: hypothetical protein NTY72_12400 [Bacteroidetes bacterium]|nr:hypothetical protein [Bacteroidota bacterium]
MTRPNNISYRDYAARVVKKEDGFYRYIFLEYKAEYEHLMQSGLYEELIQKELLIEHKEIQIEIDDPKVYKLLYPTQIAFQSYPFEWSYKQWIKAILAYLKINHIALKYGMILKDATPYNIYLTEGKAVMFDTSSFMFFKKNDNWIAYRQFCETFLSPIVLMHYNGAEWSKLTIAELRGLHLNFVSKQLPLKSWFNLTTLINIHLHSRYYGKINTTKNELKKNKGFTVEKLKSLHQMIFKTITNWVEPYLYANKWADYYENDIESEEYLEDKETTIRKWLETTKPKSVIDLGANTGKFSFIAAEYAELVIALEADDNCVDKIEKCIVENKINNIVAIIGNLTEPSPTLGLLNNETESIYFRANSEMALALAITHHLYITNKMCFDQIAAILNKFCSKYLIVEFIEIDDKRVQKLLENNHTNQKDYTESNFIKSFGSYFKILEIKKIHNSNRSIILMEKSLNT